MPEIHHLKVHRTSKQILELMYVIKHSNFSYEETWPRESMCSLLLKPRLVFEFLRCLSLTFSDNGNTEGKEKQYFEIHSTLE